MLLTCALLSQSFSLSESRSNYNSQKLDKQSDLFFLCCVSMNSDCQWNPIINGIGIVFMIHSIYIYYNFQ